MSHVILKGHINIFNNFIWAYKSNTNVIAGNNKMVLIYNSNGNDKTKNLWSIKFLNLSKLLFGEMAIDE